MKKLFVLAALFTTVFVGKADAQQNSNDPAAMVQRVKDALKPQLIEKAKLSEAQADKVLEIQFNYRAKMRSLRDLSEGDRKIMFETLQTAQNKEYKAIPLTDEQLVAVNTFFDDQRKKMQEQREKNNGNGGN